jgi:hypothetical protein
MPKVIKAPWEAVEMELCFLYHCLPSELDQEDFERIMTHYELWGAKQEALASR